MKALLINYYEFFKIKISNWNNLKQHKKFWIRKKIRSKKWNFYAIQKFIMQNYKICIVVVLWIFVKQKHEFKFDKKKIDKLKYLNNWINRAFNSKLLDMIEKIRKYLFVDDLKNNQNEKLRNHIFFVNKSRRICFWNILFRQTTSNFFRIHSSKQ